MFHEGGVPKEKYSIEIGDVNVIQEGKDVTILTVGAALYRAMDAAKELKEKYFADEPSFSERSWGMSHDYPIAIETGSTMVRVGTKIFGEREYSN